MSDVPETWRRRLASVTARVLVAREHISAYVLDGRIDQGDVLVEVLESLAVDMREWIENDDIIDALRDLKRGDPYREP